jgi:hypothetical protein
MIDDLIIDVAIDDRINAAMIELALGRFRGQG